jgi:hypothetical protein
MADTRIVAVICNNNDTSYTVVLERDGVRVRMARWSYVHAVANTRSLTRLFEQQLAAAGAMSHDEWLNLYDAAEDLYDE